MVLLFCYSNEKIVKQSFYFIAIWTIIIFMLQTTKQKSSYVFYYIYLKMMAFILKIYEEVD